MHDGFIFDKFTLILTHCDSSLRLVYVPSQSGRLVSDIFSVTQTVANTSSCASLCEAIQTCLSFEYSSRQQTCILHDGIEGPNSGTLENIFSTPELQNAEGYMHYEKLGVGNSTAMTFSGLDFEHDTLYYINLRLINGLGYENVVTSSGFLVDLTPPLPGVIGGGNSVSLVNTFPGGCVTADVPILGCVGGVSSRAIDR